MADPPAFPPLSTPEDLRRDGPPGRNLIAAECRRRWLADDGVRSASDALRALATDTPPFSSFGSEGDYLFYVDVVGDSTYALSRFPLDPERLIEVAQSRVTRDFTADECRRFDLTSCG